MATALTMAWGSATMQHDDNFRDTVVVAAKIAEARDPAACAALFRAVIARHGFTTFACGHLDVSSPARAVFHIIDWPQSWKQYYVREGLLARAPIVHELRSRTSPFSWSDLAAERKLPELGAEALEQLALHGWTEGLAVPIPQGASWCGLVSLAGARPPLGEGEKRVLALLSRALYLRARALAVEYGCALPPAGLSRREIQCMRLVASGERDKGVGEKLGISYVTAHEHFENAKRKLKAANRAQAIAVAVALGII